MQGSPIHGFRLSHQQRSWWLLHQGRPAACARCAVEATGRVDGLRLRQALERVMDRHQVLRTTFHRPSGMAVPIQVIGEPGFGPGWQELDLSSLAPEVQEERLAELWRRAGQAELDLSQAPLLRAWHAKLAATRHRLVLSLPVLCADVYAMSNLVRELGRAYGDDGYEDGEDGAAQYLHVSEWQHESVDEEEEGREGRAFWEKQDLCADPTSRWPWQRTSTAGAEPGAAEPRTAEVSLDAADVARLAELAEFASSSLDVALMTAWAVLLWRMTGRERSILALEADGRHLEELADVLGLVARSLPVSTVITGSSRFVAVLEDLRTAVSEATEWQSHWVPRPSNGIGPLMAGFAFEQRPVARTSSGVELTLVEQEARFEPRALALRCLASRGSVSAVLAFDPDLFAAADVQRLAASFQTLVASAARHPEAAVETLEILPAAERRLLLVDFNHTQSPLSEPLLAHRRFERQAKRSPLRPAVCHAGEKLTYGELNGRANRLARHLRERGAGPETVVAISLPRSVETIVGILAILKSGAAYLPVDAGQGAVRLARMLEDSRAALLIGRAGAVPPGLEAVGTGFVDLELEGGLIAALSADDLADDGDADSLAYVLFTSGSTGRPKGVGVAHRQLANYVSALDRQLALAGDVSFALASTFAADLGHTCVFGALLNGHCLHVLSEETALDGQLMASYFERHGIDVLKIVPSHLQALHSGSEDAARPLPRRWLVLGGEAFPAALARELRRAHPEVRLLNHYGPSESTVGVLTHRVEDLGEDGEAGSTVPLGRPLANCRVYLVDDRLEPVPAGVPGQIAIAGICLARGYVHGPALTAERFVPDPLAAELDGDGRGERLYLTGDRARLRSDGTLEFLGRIDHQVKIRGFRVEPHEVAAVLREHPGVRDAVVTTARESAGADPSGSGLGPVRLAAYVVARRRASAEIEGRKRYALANGMAVVQRNRNETEYLYEEIFVRRTYARHGIRLPEDAVVLDLGANIGMFTMFIALCRPGARILSFEPLAPTYETLRLNAELYAPRARVFHAGVADEEGSAEFTFYPEHTMMSGLASYADPELERQVVKRSLVNAQRHGSRDAAALLEYADELIAGRFEGEPHECRLRRLSNVIREEGIDHVHLLKIDVQRAELDVLRGIDDDHWPLIDQVVMEPHQEDGGATAGRIAEIVALLEGRGFETLVEQDELLEGTDRYSLFAWRRDRIVEGEELASLAAAARPAPEAEVVARTGLRQWLEARLPEAMCPAHFVWLEALPLNRNGKVDRAALPAPEQAPESVVPPRTPLEAAIADIWSQVLKVEPVGVETNFFGLGGHSLLATQVISRVRRDLAVDVPVRSLFEAGTVAGLAERVEAARAASRAAAPVSAGGVEIQPQDDLETQLSQLELLSDEEAATLSWQPD